jgi:hypothetical protein
MKPLPAHPADLMGALLVLRKPRGWQSTVITPSGRTATFRGHGIGWRVSGYTSSAVTLRATRSKHEHTIAFNILSALLLSGDVLVDDS